MTQQNETKPKIHLTAEQMVILAEIPRKDQEQGMYRPGSPVAKLFGCTCNVIDNGGGAGGVLALEKSNGEHQFLIYTDATRKCPLHIDMVEKKKK